MKFFTSIEGLQEINMQYNWMEVRKGWSDVPGAYEPPRREGAFN